MDASKRMPRRLENIFIMTNPKTQDYAGFTRGKYRELLRMARDNYSILDFEQCCSSTAPDPFVVWRHDLDMSVHAALNFARMEAEEGVRATYFLLMHSQFYNLFEKDVADRVREISSLGHAIGLHFDSHFYEISSGADLERLLKREQHFLEDMFGEEIKVFSFHNTNAFTLGCRDLHYAGMINAFGEYFQSGLRYCSDSNGRWKYQTLEDMLREGGFRGLQVTTHPELWTDEPMSPLERVRRCISGRADATWSTWQRLLTETGRAVDE